MTATKNTTTYTQAITVQPVEVVYSVKAKRNTGRVTVSMSGAYSCNCHSFTLYGGCDHVEAVQAERKAQGRKF
jgi:hypothetical protein